MNRNEMRVGQKVFFGRSHGEKTLGEIVKINLKTVKIKQLEGRGSFKAHAIGTVWSVAHNLVSLAPQDAMPETPVPVVAPIVRRPTLPRPYPRSWLRR